MIGTLVNEPEFEAVERLSEFHFAQHVNSNHFEPFGQCQSIPLGLAPTIYMTASKSASASCDDRLETWILRSNGGKHQIYSTCFV